ncbi:hypothetical protein N431DRAFT_77954 [Stipitochalara longipes BDJ]|nr:hypothetical protein N431DRAFT_77954 [Stipitochalara longipes BDJ]
MIQSVPSLPLYRGSGDSEPSVRGRPEPSDGGSCESRGSHAVREPVNHHCSRTCVARYQPCACSGRRLMYQHAWPRLACAFPLPHGPKSRRPGCCCWLQAWHGMAWLQGRLALGSAEARRLARPVSGLRCSGTLIVHIQHPSPLILVPSIFWPRAVSHGGSICGGPYFPIGSSAALGLFLTLFPQQLHAVAELPRPHE